MQPTIKPATLEIYKCNLGIFLKSFMSSFSFQAIPDSFLINGKKPSELTLHNNFYFLRGDSDIVSFQQLKPSSKKFSHWKLIDESLASDKIPLTLTEDQLSQVWDEDDEQYVYKGEYKTLSSLYEAVTTTTEPELQDRDFEVKVLHEFTIENWEKPTETKVTLMQAGNFGAAKKTELDLSHITEYYELERLVIPEPLWHTRPCYISEKNLYRIVRNYIKENHNPKYAKITSDYDFCFAVAKVVKVKPYNVKLHTGSKRKVQLREKSTREFPLLKFTYKGAGSRTSGYEGYNCIGDLKADNFDDLKKRLKVYLDELIEYINVPLEECCGCDGTGVVLQVAPTLK